MGVWSTAIRGQVLLARGRCPACGSEETNECGVCLDYRGPFPVEKATLARWAGRFTEIRRSVIGRAAPWPVGSRALGRPV